MNPESGVIAGEAFNKSFIRKIRREGAADDIVVYFKNAPYLQSVEDIEHIHVPVCGTKEDLLNE